MPRPRSIHDRDADWEEEEEESGRENEEGGSDSDGEEILHADIRLVRPIYREDGDEEESEDDTQAAYEMLISVQDIIEAGESRDARRRADDSALLQALLQFIVEARIPDYLMDGLRQVTTFQEGIALLEEVEFSLETSCLDRNSYGKETDLRQPVAAMSNDALEAAVREGRYASRNDVPESVTECYCCYLSWDEERTKSEGDDDDHSRVLATPCGHFFHQGCLKTWLRFQLRRRDVIQGTCPMCRSVLVSV